jgi:hypothetical protein
MYEMFLRLDSLFLPSKSLVISNPLDKKIQVCRVSNGLFELKLAQGLWSPFGKNKGIHEIGLVWFQGLKRLSTFNLNQIKCNPLWVH